MCGEGGGGERGDREEGEREGALEREFRVGGGGIGARDGEGDWRGALRDEYSSVGEGGAGSKGRVPQALGGKAPHPFRCTTSAGNQRRGFHLARPLLPTNSERVRQRRRAQRGVAGRRLARPTR
jgi:hypothetical protein